MDAETRTGGPEGFPVLVMMDGAPLAACPDEGTAERVRFLLACYAGEASPRSSRPVARPSSRPERSSAGGAWAGEDRPRAGVVYNLSGLAGGGTAAAVSDVRGELAPAPVPVSAPVALADLPARWAGPHGATVRNLGDGERYAYAVAFPKRPPAETREALKVRGARWLGSAGEWRTNRLPPAFLPGGAE